MYKLSQVKTVSVVYTLYIVHNTPQLYLNIASKHSAAAFLHILLYGGQGDEMAPNSRDRSLNLSRHSTADACLQRWVSVEVRSFCKTILCPWRVLGSGSLSVSSAVSVIGDDCNKQTMCKPKIHVHVHELHVCIIHTFIHSAKT